jgi:hypothetical protein
MNFDDLKRAWHHCDHELDTGIHLNARRLRSVLARKADAGANTLSPGDIDYTMPVALVHKQFRANWLTRIARSAGAWFAKACGAGEIAGWLQTIGLRMHRRHRIRG